MDRIRDRAYADSPYDLGTDEDNAFRDGVDCVLDEIHKLLGKGELKWS